MTGAAPVVLSVLDTAPVWEGSTPAEALRDTIDLARHAERLGCARFWVAEHHNTLSIASSSPAVLVGQLASATSTMRVGSGGVMLPNHPPLVVAEQFGTLEALHPGRIDLGVGRAPGTDPGTARALRRVDALSDAGFAEQLTELLGYFADPVERAGAGMDAGIDAVPAAGNRPSMWVLGSGGSSAELAGRLGLPFAVAHHINPDGVAPALAAYRRAFAPSPLLSRPYVIVATLVIAAPTQSRAEWLSSSLGAMILRMRGGLSQGRHTPPELAAASASTPAGRLLVEQHLAARIIGDPATVRDRLRRLLADTNADELMAVTLIHGQRERVCSYEILAEALAGARVNR